MCIRDSDISFECTRRSEFEAFGPLGRVKCPTVWQPDDQTAKIIYSTDKSGIQEEIVPAANHFKLELDHFNMVIENKVEQKLSTNDALWNSNTLETISKSITSGNWENI